MYNIGFHIQHGFCIDSYNIAFCDNTKQQVPYEHHPSLQTSGVLPHMCLWVGCEPQERRLHQVVD